MTTNSQVFQNANTVILCVKPKDVLGLLSEVSSSVSKNHLLVSLAAGVQIKNLEKVI